MQRRAIVFLLATLLAGGCEQTPRTPSQPLIVHFENGTSDLTADALTTIWEYAREQKLKPTERYLILSLSLPSKSDEGLGLRRRSAVKDALTRAGIPGSSLELGASYGDIAARPDSEQRGDDVVVLPTSFGAGVTASAVTSIVVGPDYQSPWPPKRSKF